jgi:hypothetical protein
MATTVISAELVRVDDPLDFTERAAIAGFLAGYTGNTLVSYTTDLSRSGLDGAVSARDDNDIVVQIAEQDLTMLGERVVQGSVGNGCVREIDPGNDGVEVTSLKPQDRAVSSRNNGFVAK